MDRLTSRWENNGKVEYTRNGRSSVMYEDLKKLGKFEDLEEQIGCPLEVREKAFDKGFYDENDDSADATVMGLGLVIGNTVNDLHLLEFYKHKFGKISIKEFVDFMNKENKHE